MRSADALLVAQIRRGDAEAGRRFIREFYPGLYRYLLGLTENRDEAADLLKYDAGGYTDSPFAADARLRKKPLILLISPGFVEPYAGTTPPSAPATLASGLAERLRDARVTVAYLKIGAEALEAGTSRPAPPPNLIHLTDPGDDDGGVFGGPRLVAATLPDVVRDRPGRDRATRLRRTGCVRRRHDRAGGATSSE